MPKDQEYLNQLEREKYELWGQQVARVPTAAELMTYSAEAFGSPRRGVVVAEGDSWFDYPIGRDILHQLKKKHRYDIAKVAAHGDTLENMVYGTKIDGGYRPKPPSWWETKKQLERYQPNIFLFSGGGNDFAGPELESLLNHAASQRGPIREEVVRYIIGVAAKKSFLDLCSRVWQASEHSNILLHGYGTPTPDGRHIRIIIGWAGPWLRPYLARKGILDPAQAQDVMRELVATFNEMLLEVANTDPRIHYLDLRSIVTLADWENELHLSDEGYERIADVYHEKIVQLGGP